MNDTQPTTGNSALFQTEEKFKLLTRLLPLGVCTTDKNGTINYFNETALKLWGWTPDHQDITAFYNSLKIYDRDGKVIPQERNPITLALQSCNSVYDEEVMIERPDGTRISALISIEILYDEDHQQRGVLGVYQDTTERNKAEIGLKRLAAIVESSDDAIISKTLQGIITSWNSAAIRIFGYNDEEIIGKPINILIPAGKQDEEREIISKIKAGERIDHFETVRSRKDGSEINISLTVSPIKNDRGEIIGASKIARDITNRVKIDKQLKEYADQLKELNNYKDDFMAMASHELKTPLTVIKANLQLLELRLEDDPNHTFINNTMKQVNKLGNLISDLFDVTKIQAGQLQLNLTEFDLNDLVAETIGNIAHTSNSHTIQSNIQKEDVKIKADYLRLEQVLINLLTNAIKYSPSADQVILTTNVENKNVVVSVKDFGIGIPNQDLEKVFTRFFRVKGLASTFSGSGIGLYISSEIVKHHGGKMWVESEENVGSIFYFSIPLN
ncbi:MAG: PAS domain S-box protein [Ginsengibacter sp.]